MADQLPHPFSPLPEGSLARLAYPWVPSELATCRDHLFRVRAAEVTWVWESDTGYVQRGECQVCGQLSPRLDASWWNRQLAQQERMTRVGT